MDSNDSVSNRTGNATSIPTDQEMIMVAESPAGRQSSIDQSLNTPGSGMIRIPPIESLSGQNYTLNQHPKLGSTTGLYHIPAGVDSLHPIQTTDGPGVRITPFRTPDVGLPPHNSSSSLDIMGDHYINPSISQLDAQFYAGFENPMFRNGSGGSVDGDDDDDDDSSVCPTGSEHTGRWTKKEHELFLEALKKYGREWKKVAAMVKTRTVVQTRTHAQKYFQKVQKCVNPDGSEGDTVPPPMATVSSSGITSQASKRSRLEMESSTTDTVPAPPPPPPKPAMEFDDDYFYYDTELPAHMRRAADGVGAVGGVGSSVDIPPPSPASCGKRKAAEVAVAQALTSSTSPIDMERGIHTLAVMKEAVLRPRAGARAANTRSVGGLSIINPDNLPSNTREEEPITPWDGEMKELEKKQKSSTTHVLVSTTDEQNEFIRKVCAAAANGDVRALTKLLDAAKITESLHAAGPAMVRDLIHSDGNGTSVASAAPPTSAMAPPTPTSLKSAESADKPAASFARSDEVKAGSIVTEMLNRVNDCGESALMIACYNGDGKYSRSASGGKQGEAKKHTQQRTVDVCKVLVEHGASTTLVNAQLRSCLHIAALEGFEMVAKYLILKGAPVNDQDINGDTPSHIAARRGHLSMLHLLTSCGANCHIRNNAARCALDVAQDCPETGTTREEIRDTMMQMEPRLRSLILYHEDCLEHAARRESDWEGPDRLQGIMTMLMDSNMFPPHRVEISNQFDKAHVELLSRVHSSEYIAFVNALSKKVQEESDNSRPVPFTPLVQKSMMSRHEGDTKRPEVCDTSFSGGTLKAARRAAGAVAHAVDRVLLGRSRNAFCVVRPPGHHAGYRGLLDGAKSCGFCIFNSVAAGALHALEEHNCERVAIIDIDVHHGNGTEDIVRRYQHPSRLFFFSCHLYENEDGDLGEFFPGSGREDDTAHNIINVPILPMWRDPTAGSHGTRSASKPAAGSTVRTGRETFRQAIVQRLIPALRAFSPDLILLSTGFDMAEGDVGNLRSNSATPMSPGVSPVGMNLRHADFEWVTRELVNIADICCNGRLVSVLEGGYGSYPPIQGPSGGSRTSSVKVAGSTENQRLGYMDRTILSRASCAHVCGLIDPYGHFDSGEGP